MSNKNSRGKRKETNPVDEAILMESTIEETAITEETPAFEMYSAVVSDCFKLNVREQPSLHAEILTVLNNGDEIYVDKDSNDDSWYHVTLPDGTTGFSMKSYITILN